VLLGCPEYVKIKAGEGKESRIAAGAAAMPR
jgi:hypothetical protein